MKKISIRDFIQKNFGGITLDLFFKEIGLDLPKEYTNLSFLDIALKSKINLNRKISDLPLERFSLLQKLQIYKGLVNKIKIHYYNPEFSWEQMDIIRIGTEEGLDSSIYAFKWLTVKQMQYIYEILKLNLNPLYLLTEGFTDEQSFLVYKGILDNIDVSYYANKELSVSQMKAISRALYNGCNVLRYCTGEFEYDQIHELMLGQMHNVNIKLYLNPRYSAGQMSLIREGLEKKINIKELLNPDMSYDDMLLRLTQLEIIIDNLNALSI